MLNVRVYVTFEQQFIQSYLRILRERYAGRRVKLKKSRLYMGREAQIDGIILSPEGEILYLAMVLRCDDNKTFLNDKPKSRSYWQYEDLEWL